MHTNKQDKQNEVPACYNIKDNIDIKIMNELYSVYVMILYNIYTTLNL